MKKILTTALTLAFLFSASVAFAWETQIEQRFKVGEIKEFKGKLTMNLKSPKVQFIPYEDDPDEGVFYSRLPDPEFQDGSSYRVEATCEVIGEGFYDVGIRIIKEDTYVAFAGTDDGEIYFYLTGNCSLMYTELVPIKEKRRLQGHGRGLAGKK